MKKSMATMLVAVLVCVGLTACGGKSSDKPGKHAHHQRNTAPAATTPTQPAAEQPAGAADATQQKLIGTTWQVGDIQVTFTSANKVKLAGGPIANAAPNGLDADYSYQNGTLEVTALGQTKNGTWDGDKLVVDGNVAVKK
jgi:hypothetical protein